MENKLVFRNISALLFLIMWSVRKYYEQQFAKVAKQGLFQDKDDKGVIAIQRLLLAISLIALPVYIIYPKWLEWSIIGLTEEVRWTGAVVGAA